MADGELHRLFAKNLKGFHFQRVETGGTGLGIPDVNYCCDGAEGWIENKWTDSWRVKVRTEQVGWAERRARAGGRVFMAVRQTGRQRNDLWLLHSGAFRQLIDGRRLNELDPWLVYLHCEGGAAAWPWDKVINVLIGPKSRVMP